MTTYQKPGILTLLFLCVLVIKPLDSLSQTKDNPTWVTLNLGYNEYRGDFSNELFFFDITNDIGGGFGVSQYLNPSFDASISFFVTNIDTDFDPGFNKTVLQSSLVGKYKLTNDYLFSSESGIHPFLFMGLGLTNTFRGSPNAPDKTLFNLPIGLGFDIPLAKTVQFSFTSTYNPTFSDGLDGVTGVDSRNDNYLIHTVGLKFSLGKKLDTDGDGIKDKNDNCPNAFGDKTAFGCPDADGDTIQDSIDRCPETSGLSEFAGCADSDSDKIPDYEDECPNMSGESDTRGCPDSDKDGIIDSEDACPTIKGIAPSKGCPDSDADGTIDSKDMCPNSAGSSENGGCPDTDNDGTLDKDDACINEVGTKANDGCPNKKSTYGLKGTVDTLIDDGYTIVLYSLTNEKNAISKQKEFEAKGYRSLLVPLKSSSYGILWRVSLGQFASPIEAEEAAKTEVNIISSSYLIKRI